MPVPKEQASKKTELKNLEIPRLDDYESAPNDEFWESFPKMGLPAQAETAINIDKFNKGIEEVKGKMTASELKRATKVLDDLRSGADAYQRSPLPPVNTFNAKTAYENGQILTDTIATWIKKGFVAGPFYSSPLPGFRVNPLGAVVRNGKIRPILNMSGPKNRSFNDNVAREKLERLHMGTAKQFGGALKKAGKNAVFSKLDIQDAYKLVPAKPEDYRLQGFSWLGKYFVETRLSFGGVPSPCNFDRMGSTKDLIVCLKSNTKRNAVHRALDDSPCVGLANSEVPGRFSAEMRRFCGETGIPLAENCPLADKAFEMETRGTVLGVGFDSKSLTWFLSPAKADKVIERCWGTIRVSHTNLERTQQLMGSVNDLAQMCPLLKFYKRSGNDLIRKFGGNENILIMVPEELKKDLAVIAKVAESSKLGLPIAGRASYPPLAAIVVNTDAAGASFSMFKGERVCHNNEGKGVSCLIGEDEDNITA